MAPASGVCFTVENDMHLPGPEHVEVLVMHLSDLLFQDLIAGFPCRGWASASGVVGARSDLQSCLLQDPADRLDSELFLVLVDV